MEVGPRHRAEAVPEGQLLGELRDANAKLVVETLRSKDLAEEAAQAEALFNALPDVIARYDRAHRYRYLNTAAERLLGRSRTEFLGKTNAEVGFPVEHASEWDGLLLETFAHGRSLERFFTFVLPDGRREFHVRTIPERGSTQAVTSVVTVARDVTESAMYHAARADADRVRRIQTVTAAFSSAPTPRDVAQVLATQAQEALAADGALVMLLDKAGERLELAGAVGYPAAVVDEWSAIPLETHLPLPDVVRSGIPLYFTTRRSVLERYPALASDRHESDEALAAIPLTFNEHTLGAVALVFRSTRSFAESDRAFISSLAQLSAQAIDRARLLDAERLARRDAEAANGLKDDFLATMSHELRTPLNAVLGWATLLRGRLGDTVLAKRGIEAIERNARIQTRLVEDTLDVSRIVSGKLKLDLEPVDVETIVAAAVDVMRGAAEAKQVELDVSFKGICRVNADPGRLQQVVWNLVSNAVKFTSEGGRIDVSVHCAATAGVVIAVQDTGVGIPPDFLPRAFDRFRQLDGSTTRRQGGLGIGLSIVRQLVELHGGTVEAKSDGVGKGASFIVTLPAASEEGPVGTEPVSAGGFFGGPRALAGKRILLVDDDDDARDILAIALEECGADVCPASSADDALAKIAARKPDAMVCDIGMPVTDGYMLMRAVRALPVVAGGTVPAIAVTGFARTEDASRALEAGFQQHLAKPVELQELVEAVTKLLAGGS